MSGYFFKNIPSTKGVCMFVPVDSPMYSNPHFYVSVYRWMMQCQGMTFTDHSVFNSNSLGTGYAISHVSKSVATPSRTDFLNILHSECNVKTAFLASYNAYIDASDVKISHDNDINIVFAFSDEDSLINEPPHSYGSLNIIDENNEEHPIKYGFPMSKLVNDKKTYQMKQFRIKDELKQLYIDSYDVSDVTTETFDVCINENVSKLQVEQHKGAKAMLTFCIFDGSEHCVSNYKIQNSKTKCAYDLYWNLIFTEKC